MHLTLVVENDLYFMFANKHGYQTILLKTYWQAFSVTDLTSQKKKRKKNTNPAP